MDSKLEESRGVWQTKLAPTWLLSVLLAAAVVKLWLLPLPSSFWVDEMVTAFLVHYGPAHPSLAVAPQLGATIYYWLPKAAERLLGFSETAYRLPSFLAMLLALFLLARLAARLIHPQAAWFVPFAALTLRSLNYEAADARPYALATLVSVAAILFLVRWLDHGRWLDAGAFIATGALLWRVHLIDWPFYCVFVAYALSRALRRETPVPWWQIGLVFALMGAALYPVWINALALFRDARAHVIVQKSPTWRELGSAFKFLLVASCGAGAWIVGSRLPRSNPKPVPLSVVVLVLSWWSAQPLALFAFSRITGNSVFIPRYLSLSLPGVAMTATLAAAYFLPARFWRISGMLLGVGVLLFMGEIHRFSPPHHNSDWRLASKTTRELGLDAATPVIYPSPFIEAKFPTWQPHYTLPGFLYCHLLIYPVGGAPYLLPFESSPEARQYAASLAAGALAAAGRFIIYGDEPKVRLWQSFFTAQPDLAGWRSQRYGPFGDVEVAAFESPQLRLSSNLVRPSQD
jgi:hypothetical protein